MQIITLITIFIIQILAGAEIDIFVPSFPELRQVFNLTPFMVELTLGVNLSAHCITCLVVGNLGDRYGRKPIIILGLIIFVIGSLCCTFATNFWVLLVGRFFQGIGIASPTVLAYLVIADMYNTDKQQQIMGIFNGVVTIAMASAPVIGSYVTLYYGWRGNFMILLGLGILSLVLCIFFIPKGKVNHGVTLSLRAYLHIFKSKRAIYYMILMNFFTQAYWIFIAIAPILYMEGFAVSLEHFGFYQGAMAAFFAVLSFLSGYAMNEFGKKRCFAFSIYSLICFVVGCMVLILFNVHNPLIITLVCLLLSLGNIFPINILWPLALEAVPDSKGRMAAIMISSRLIVTAILIQIVSYFYDGSFTHLGAAMSLSIMIGMWASYKLFHDEKISI